MNKKVRNGPHPGISSVPETPVIHPVMHARQPSLRQASAPYNASPQGKSRQSSAGYAENVGPRHPGNDSMARQASFISPSPLYPAPVEIARAQDQMVVPMPSQNYRNVTGVLPNPMGQQFVPNQLTQAQQFVAHMTYQAMIPNASIMVGPPPDPRHMYNGNSNAIMQPISEVTNYQQFPPDTVIRQLQVTGVGPQDVLVNISGHAHGSGPDRESRLYNPYGPANTGFSQGLFRGRGRSKPSFSVQSGRGRKFSSGSYGRGGYGQHTRDRSPYQGSYHDPRQQGSPFSSVPHQQEHHNTTAIHNQGTEPFPPFDASQQPLDLESTHFQAPGYKALGPHPTGPRALNPMPLNDSGDYMVENLDPEHGCGKDWIGPSCEKVRCLWVHGISKDVTEATFKQFFEQSTGFPIIEAGIQEDKNRHRYAFVQYVWHYFTPLISVILTLSSFNTASEARKALQLNGIEFNGRPLFVQVPQKFYTPPIFEKSWNQRQSNNAKNRRMSLPFSHGIRCGSAGGPSHYSNIPMAIRETVSQEFQNAKQYTAGRRAPSVPQINQQEEYNSSFERARVATTLPLYSPQDARSDLLRSSIHRSPATKGSPEMKKPKRKSAKSSPKKSKPAVKGEKIDETVASPTQPSKKSDMTNQGKTSEISEINTDAPTKLTEDADVTPNPAEEKPLSDATPTSTESQTIMERAHESPAQSIQSDEQAMPVRVLETTVLHQEVSTTTKSLEKLAHPQTPIKDALVCEYPAIYHTPDVEVASEDDQKQDASFHSAKESQSPKSDGKGDVKSFTEATIMISREDQAVPAQGSDVEAEEESKQKKQVNEHETLRSGIADTEIVIPQSQLSVEPPLDINKALAISALPPNSGVKQTESLYPFAKAKQQKQPQSKKKGSKKEKGKEVELPKPKIAESSTSKEAELTKPKTVESTMFTETRVDLDSSSISEVGSIKGKHGQSTQDSKADVMEEETLLEPALNSGNDSAPPGKGKQESEPIDGKGSSFYQLGETKVQVVVPSPDLQDVPVTLAPKKQNESLAEGLGLRINQNLEAARQEGEKEKKRKAIAAKVAIPRIKLRSTRLPTATVKSDSAEARSPLTQITYVTPNEDTASPLTDNKSTFADNSVSEPMKAEARQQIQDPPSRYNTSAEQDVDGMEIVGINQDAGDAIPPTSSNDSLQPDDVVSLSAETPLSTMPITASLGQTAAQPIDPLQPVAQPRIKSKKPKKKKNKTAATPEGGTLDTSPTPQPTTQQTEETQSTSAIDDGIEFGEQKMMIDGMTKGRKSSVSYYDKMHLEEKSPKAREASQSADKGKAKACSAKEQANISPLASKVDRSAELAKLYEELTAELAHQDLFDPESTERKNSIAKVRVLRIAIDARQEANVSSRSRGLDPEMVKAVMGYKMTGDAASKHFTTSKQSQGEETLPISLVKDYYTVKENEYIGKPVRGKNVDSEESGAEEPGIPITPPFFQEVE